MVDPTLFSISKSAADYKRGGGTRGAGGARSGHIVRRHTEPGSDAPPGPFASIGELTRQYDAARAVVGKPPAGLSAVVLAARRAGFRPGLYPERVIRELVIAARAEADIG